MKGTYTIVISCNRAFNVRFGRLGRSNVPKGLYVYSGSALGKGAMSLEGRLGRHSCRHKRMKWHIDYMTSSRRCEVRAAICVESRRRLECNVNSMISDRLKAHPLLPRIGASDCTCRGHLMRVTAMREKTLLQHIWAVYARFGRPVCLSINGNLR
jgi:Uri superfamily endonuclease